IDQARNDRIKKLGGHDKPVLALAASQARVATAAADGVIRVWDAKTWSPLEEFKNPYGPVWALAFSPDGKTLYWGGLDDNIHVWQVSPRKPFEPVASKFPRRFQLRTNSDDPVELGRIQFARKCSVCHTLTPDGANRAGPTLYRIFGRPIASLEGYAYSKPLYDLDIVWTPETVSRLFELGPDKFTPGSKMPLQKMTNPKQRAALIAFLKQATRAN
ncbi:MAG: c-type cytochrome, partial [Pseudomonadota bacterium]